MNRSLQTPLEEQIKLYLNCLGSLIVLEFKWSYFGMLNCIVNIIFFPQDLHVS